MQIDEVIAVFEKVFSEAPDVNRDGHQVSHDGMCTTRQDDDDGWVYHVDSSYYSDEVIVDAESLEDLLRLWFLL